MTLRHRRWHFWLWLLLAPVLAVALVLSWSTRPTRVVESHNPTSSKLQGGPP
jgi:hypothetical protein